MIFAQGLVEGHHIGETGERASARVERNQQGAKTQRLSIVVLRDGGGDASERRFGESDGGFDFLGRLPDSRKKLREYRVFLGGRGDVDRFRSDESHGTRGDRIRGTERTKTPGGSWNRIGPGKAP